MRNHPAIEFLLTLDPSNDATFHITTFTDLPKGAAKPKPDLLLQNHPEQSLIQVESLLPQLENLNKLGAGIFFCVNQCQGERKKENVKRVRCIHADFDNGTQAQLAAIQEKLSPSITVQTSAANNLHFYWVLDPETIMEKETAEAINRSLTAMGADKAAIDVSRLLRLPGFRHMKYSARGETPLVFAKFSDQHI